IPGKEEAGLILDGVRQAVPFGNKPMLVMDIGGGSTEFILATDKALMWKHSFELGTTRLVERFPAIDPMDMATQLRMATHIDAQLELLWPVIERHWPSTLVGSAGSFDTIAAMVALERGAPLGDGETTLVFSTTEFEMLKDRILPMDHARRTALPGLPPHRIDTIIPALVLIERVLLHGFEQIYWSRYSLKEGAAARMFA
ncbi:MAG: phosphatase, partial [Bacteroidetes bacterium]|nr:phosphatase [Bacteroidota bacterium]